MIEVSVGLISLFGVFLGSMKTISKDLWISKLERRRQGSYSAIRLICILEEYADKCIGVFGDDGTAHGQLAGRTEDGEEYRVARIETPDPPAYPEDIAWSGLEEPLMHRVLALANKARDTDREISGYAENAFPPDYDEFFKSRQEGYSRLGLDALVLSDDLRRQFGRHALSRSELNTDWDPKVFLQESLQEIENRRFGHGMT